MYKNHLQSHKQTYLTNYYTYDKDFEFYCPECKKYFKNLTEGRVSRTQGTVFIDDMSVKPILSTFASFAY